MSKNILLFLVKSPVSGAEKSRLAKTLGNKHAEELYRELAEFNLSHLRLLSDQNTLSIMVFLDPFQDNQYLKASAGGDFQFINQSGPGLGESLLAVFKDLFDSGAEKVMVLSSDTMELKIDLIEQAFRYLENNDIVLGPAKNGGCYLIGLSRNIPFLFHEMPWNSSHLLEQTLEKADRLQFTVKQLEELESLDSLQGMNFLSRITL